jgi:bifunctional non-homologous end joining protein LigD
VDRGSVPPTAPRGHDDVFVVHEHHATTLHWDLRLEHDGVLVSWAVPKGLPPDPKRNHLAVHVDDHDLSYATYTGTIGEGAYGAGRVTIWDSGTYETEKWTDREVKFVLHGHRTEGRFVLFRTDGKRYGAAGKDNWMIHRMDAPARPGWQPLPTAPQPMLATAGELPRRDDGWAYELKWDGVRALVAIEGGRLTLTSRAGNDVTRSYPELRHLGEQVGTTQLLLDGEIVAFDDDGRPSFSRLQNRMHVTGPARARTLSQQQPVTLVLFDLLHLEGNSLLQLGYSARRELLEALELDGTHWQTPPRIEGSGADALAASLDLRLEGVVAKRLDSTYSPGRRSPDWVKVKNVLTQDVVIGGWKPGRNSRAGRLGAVMMGVPEGDGLRYIGSVGSGIAGGVLAELEDRLSALARGDSPFDPPVPRADARDAHWVDPVLVAEVAYGEWTPDDRLRHPRWRGLRPELAPGDVVRES